MIEKRRAIATEEHHDHHEFITVLLEREKYRTAFKRSVIEKTLSSLIWAAIVFLAVSVVTYFKGFVK